MSILKKVFPFLRFLSLSSIVSLYVTICLASDKEIKVSPPKEATDFDALSDQITSNISTNHYLYRISDEDNKKILPETITDNEILIGALEYHYHARLPSKITLTVPLQENLSYIPGHTTDEDSVLLSIDGGQSYQALSEIPDTKLSDISHIQWRYDRPFYKGEQKILKYKVQFKQKNKI